MAEKANILLVDDRDENLVALEAILSSLDQNMIRARSGEEALSAADQRVRGDPAGHRDAGDGRLRDRPRTSSAAARRATSRSSS